MPTINQVARLARPANATEFATDDFARELRGMLGPAAKNLQFAYGRNKLGEKVIHTGGMGTDHPLLQDGVKPLAAFKQEIAALKKAQKGIKTAGARKAAEIDTTDPDLTGRARQLWPNATVELVPQGVILRGHPDNPAIHTSLEKLNARLPPVPQPDEKLTAAARNMGGPWANANVFNDPRGNMITGLGFEGKPELRLPPGALQKRMAEDFRLE